MAAIDLSTLKISSSWIVGHGDVVAVGARRASGKKIQPRKKRGPPMSEAQRLEIQAKVDSARQRRRAGLSTGPRDL